MVANIECPHFSKSVDPPLLYEIICCCDVVFISLSRSFARIRTRSVGVWDLTTID